jgi:hypothetical protein
MVMTVGITRAARKGAVVREPSARIAGGTITGMRTEWLKFVAKEPLNTR